MAESVVEVQARVERSKLARNIRSLERRLQEVEAIDLNRFDDAELAALEVGIGESLSQAFGVGSYSFEQYRSAAKLLPLGVREGLVVNGDMVADNRTYSRALLKRAIQSLTEQLEDRLPSDGSAHQSIAGRAMLGVTRVGSGVSAQGQAGELTDLVIGDTFLERAPSVASRPQDAFAELQARIEVLEALIRLPRAGSVSPIGLGHNGPPEFDNPISEDEIQDWIDLFKAQTPAPVSDVQELKDAAKTIESETSKAKQYLDAFASEVVKSAGSEVGKRLAQVPFWYAIISALTTMVHAANTWLSTLP